MPTKRKTWVPSAADLEEQHNLLAELNSLQANPTQQFDKLVYWLRDNSNSLCRAYLGDSGRIFQRGSSHNVNVTIEGSTCFITADCIWPYDNLLLKHPDLKKLSQYLPDIALSVDTDNDYLLKVKIQFDAEKWPHLVSSVVYKKMYFAKLGPGENLEAKDKALKEAALLIDRFFPDVNMNALEIGIDLGMFDSFETFTSWFHAPQPSHCENAIPSDFV